MPCYNVQQSVTRKTKESHTSQFISINGEMKIERYVMVVVLLPSSRVSGEHHTKSKSEKGLGFKKRTSIYDLVKYSKKLV